MFADFPWILTGLIYGGIGFGTFLYKIQEEGFWGALAIGVGWLPYFLINLGLVGADLLGDILYAVFSSIFDD